jgi:ferredoxin
MPFEGAINSIYGAFNGAGRIAPSEVYATAKLTQMRLPSPRSIRILACKTEFFMADVANKYPENVPGKYYVDNQCIDCDLCRETAPDNFKRNEDGGYSYVSKQPENPDEETRCKEAKEGCPVEAIGDNGA